MSFGLTSTGYLPRTSAEYLALFEARLSALGVEVPAYDSPAGIIATLLANMLGEIDEGIAVGFDAFDPDNAEGQQLAGLYSLFRLSLAAAQPAQVSALIEGTPGTVLVPGSEIRPDGDDVSWILQSGVTVGEEGVFVREVAGEYIVSGSSWDIITPAAGWSGVTVTPSSQNPTRGSDEESDGQFRRRAEGALSRVGFSTKESIQSELRRLPFLTDAYVAENDGNSDLALNGITLPPKSFAAVVLPSALTDEQIEAVALAISAVKPVSVQSFGLDVSTTVTAADVQSMSVDFSYGVERAVTIAVTATRRSGFTAAATRAQIEAAIESHVAALGLGDGLCILELMGILAGLDSVKSASITLDGAGDDITAGPVQVITSSLAAGNLSVVVS